MCVPPEKRLLLVITNLLPETPWACLYHFLNGNAFLRTTDYVCFTRHTERMSRRYDGIPVQYDGIPVRYDGIPVRYDGILGGFGRARRFAAQARTPAVLDRLTHRCHILEASGESYRLKSARKRLKTTAQGN